MKARKKKKNKNKAAGFAESSLCAHDLLSSRFHIVTKYRDRIKI